MSEPRTIMQMEVHPRLVHLHRIRAERRRVLVALMRPVVQHVLQNALLDGHYGWSIQWDEAIGTWRWSQYPK